MNSRSFLELCKDSQMYEKDYVEKAIDSAQARAVFAHQAAIKLANDSSPHKAPNSAVKQIRGKPLKDNHNTNVANRIGFDDFLSALITLAKKCYPSAASDDEEAMKCILMDNVLPFASRRMPSDNRSVIDSKELLDLFKYYESSLASLFNYFSSSADEESDSWSSPVNKGRSPKSSSNNNGSKVDMGTVFGDMSISGEVDDGTTADMPSHSVKKLKNRTQQLLSNNKRMLMSYTSFMRFVNEFKLGVIVNLTNFDAGDLYLTQIARKNFEPNVRKLTLVDFWELLVACALHIYRDREILSPLEKVKAIIMVMWRHLEETTREKMAGTKSLYKRSVSSVTEKGELLKITQMFNERFINAWKKDGYADYLLGPNMTKRDHMLSHSESPFRTINHPSMLSKLMSKDSASPSQHTSTPPSSNAKDSNPLNLGRLEGAASGQLDKLMRTKPQQTDLMKQVMYDAAT